MSDHEDIVVSLSGSDDGDNYDDSQSQEEGNVQFSVSMEVEGEDSHVGGNASPNGQAEEGAETGTTKGKGRIRSCAMEKIDPTSVPIPPPLSLEENSPTPDPVSPTQKERTQEENDALLSQFLAITTAAKPVEPATDPAGKGPKTPRQKSRSEKNLKDVKKKNESKSNLHDKGAKKPTKSPSLKKITTPRVEVPAKGQASPRRSPRSATTSGSSPSGSSSSSGSAPARQTGAVQQSQSFAETNGQRASAPVAFLSTSHLSAAITPAKVDKDTVLKCGWLYKKGRKRHSWKKRWFVIQPNLVSYYSDSSCTPRSFKGAIVLKRSQCRMVLKGSASQNLMFGLLAPERDLDLRATNIGEVAGWIEAFERGIAGTDEGPMTVRKQSRAGLKSVRSGPGKYGLLVKVLTEKDNRRVRDLFGSATAKKDEKELAGQLIHVFELNGNTHEYLDELISSSVSSCNKATTLFRGNGVPEKALTNYCYLVGLEYLKRSLKPLLFSVMNSEHQYEIDPDKLEPGSDLKSNIVNLLSVSEMFIAKITASKFTNVPYPIRCVCRQLAVATSEKFSDGLYSVIGGLFFLRFICPALTVPQEIGVWGEELSPSAKRALLLITKTLMNLSNGVRFGKKEQYMVPMNDFIEQNEKGIRKFFDNLILPPGNQDEAQREEEEELKKQEQDRRDSFVADESLLSGLVTNLRGKIPKMRELESKNENLEEKERTLSTLIVIEDMLKVL